MHREGERVMPNIMEREWFDYCDLAATASHNNSKSRFAKEVRPIALKSATAMSCLVSSYLSNHPFPCWLGR